MADIKNEDVVKLEKQRIKDLVKIYSDPTSAKYNYDKKPVSS